MTYTTSNAFTEQVQAFQSLEADQQLALFWFIYTEMGESITPAAPGASTVSPGIAEGLFEQVKAMSREEQLQIQRDLVAHKNTAFTRQYGAIGDTTKLLFWYLLAQGMDNGSVVPMPPDYKLSSAAESLFNQIKRLEFNEQITFFRDIVSPMGVDPNAVEHDPKTGL
jgi:hypothetical protein